MSEPGDFQWSNTGGVLRIIDENGNEGVCGDRTPTSQEEAEHRQARATADASTQDDFDEYERLQYEDPDFEAVKAQMVELAGHADPEDAARINSDYRSFVTEYRALKNAMVGHQVDAPRHNAIAELREQLREEDEMTGCRQTARRTALVERIARLHGGGR